MRILVDIGHPAHVHCYRVMAQRLINNGHSVVFTARPKEVTLELLEHYGLPYIVTSKPRSSKMGKVISTLRSTWITMRVAYKFKPDLFMNASINCAFTSFLFMKPHICMEDTFNMEQVRVYLPFSDTILTGDYPHPMLGSKEIQFPGYHELAYLHPNVYDPDSSILDELGVRVDQKYAIVRFIGWSASHDAGLKGFSRANKIALVEELSKILKVFISSEVEIIPELAQYVIKIKPERMHDAIAYSSLFIGEGATMAEEAAVLGVPSIYVNSIGLGIIPDLVKYGLLDHFSESYEDQQRAISLALEYAESDDVKRHKQVLREAMLKQRIDVSAFLTWFVENYPRSRVEMLSSDFTFKRFY